MHNLIEKIVPENHLVRKLKEVLDFSFVPDELNEYCAPKETPIINPVLIAKYLLIIHLYDLNKKTPLNISAETHIEQSMATNMTYRFLLGIDIDESVPCYNEIMHTKEMLGNREKWAAILERLSQQCKDNGLPYKQGSAWNYA
jgi:hypothetical protein